MQNKMRDKTAITLISQCRYNKNLINDIKSGKLYQVNIDITVSQLVVENIISCISLKCGRHKIFTDQAKEQIRENIILFFIAAIFGKTTSNKRKFTSGSREFRIQILYLWNETKVLSHSSLRRSSKCSLERQHKIKVVYLHDKTIYTAIGERKLFLRAAILNLIRTIILQMKILKHSLFLFSEVTWSASKSFQQLTEVSHARKAGLLWPSRHSLWLTRGNPNLVCYFTLPPATVCHLCTPSLPGALLLFSPGWSSLCS